MWQVLHSGGLKKLHEFAKSSSELKLTPVINKPQLVETNHHKKLTSRGTYADPCPDPGNSTGMLPVQFQKTNRMSNGGFWNTEKKHANYSRDSSCNVSEMLDQKSETHYNNDLMQWRKHQVAR